MRYTLVVKPNAKTTNIKYISENELHVSIKAPPREGKANEELIKTLAKFFKVPQSNVAIKHGTTGRKKIVEIT